MQLAGAAPPAALTRSLGQIRARLAEDYRLANAELAERKQELAALRLELCRQHESLADEKRRLEQWAVRREQEIQSQASRLVAREQELDRQESELRRQAEQWQVDRLGFQQEIRRLRLERQTASEVGQMK
jgi:septal ring factor EnvC (AmiA/AmiB activator)